MHQCAIVIILSYMCVHKTISFSSLLSLSQQFAKLLFTNQIHPVIVFRHLTLIFGVVPPIDEEQVPFG